MVGPPRYSRSFVPRYTVHERAFVFQIISTHHIHHTHTPPGTIQSSPIKQRFNDKTEPFCFVYKSHAGTMVHTTFRLRKLDKVKNMTSIANVGSSRVVVGMNDGCVSMFHISPEKEKMLSPACFYKPSGKVGKSPIVQLIPLPELNLLLALVEGSGAILQFQLSPDLVLKKEVRSVTSVTCMAAKKERDKYYVIAARKQKIYVLEYRDQEFTPRKELLMPGDAPRSIVWNDYGLFVGFKRESLWMSVSNAQNKKDLAFSSPCMVSMPVTDEVLLLRDREGVTLNTEAEPSRTVRLQFSQPPHAFAYSYPFIIGLTERGLEIRAFPPERVSRNSDVACQDIPMETPKMTSLPAFCDLDEAGALRGCIRRSSEPEKHAGGGAPSGGRFAQTAPVLPTQREREEAAVRTPQAPIFVMTASHNGLYCLEPVAFPAQVEELMASRDYEAALVLSSLLTPADVSDECLKRVLVQHGFHLFTAKQFQKAMRQFKLSQIDPRIIIKMFKMLPPYVDQKWSADPEDEESLEAARSVALAEVSDKFAAAEHLKSLLIDIRSSYTINTRDDLVKLDMSDMGMKMASVDTALLHCLYLRSEDDVTPFLEKPNKCVLEDCEKILRQHPPRYVDIVALYKSKGLDRRALVLLRSLGVSGGYNFSESHKDPVLKDRDLSQDERKNKELGLSGTIHYLQRLNGADDTHRDLILEFSSWVLQSKEPTIAKKLSIFTHPVQQPLPSGSASPTRQGPIGPKVVLDHLKKLLPKEAEMHMLFLETMLNDPKLANLHECRQNPVHEALIHAYIERSQVLHTQRQKLEGASDGASQTTLRAVLQEIKDVGLRLQKFLRTSDLYSVEMMKKTFADAAHAALFNRELAIIYSRLEQHDQALFILAHRLDSFDECLRYCDAESRERPLDGDYEAVLGKNISKGRLKRFDLHSTLFSLLLNPPSGMGATPKRDAALQLLNIHADKINCLEAIKQLPPDTPIQELSKWLAKVMKDGSLRQRETRLYMNISKSEHQQVAVERAQRQKDCFEIRPDTICPVCRSKIGGNSYVAYYPNKVCCFGQKPFECFLDFSFPHEDTFI